MTLLIIFAGVAFILVLIIGAAWESWRNERKGMSAAPDLGSVRFRCRPGGRATENHLKRMCTDMGFTVSRPVWGDRWHLVEGPAPQVTILHQRLLTTATDSGYSTFRERGRRTTLRHGVRFLVLERSA